MKRHRRLRRLLPDAELLQRRAAGESLRALAADYGVAHTTLGRYLARPEVASQLREAGRLVRAERRAAALRQAAARRAERQVRRRAREQAALERKRARRLAARWRWPPRSAYERWLYEQDARQPLLRADLRSHNDELAARTVEAGGGIEGLIEATGLHTRANALNRIEPAILVRAFDNDAAASAAAPPDRSRLRRLVPDLALVRRRAAGESLRRLARDYGVTHTTLGRWFARPEVTRQLRLLRPRSPSSGAGRAPSG